MDKITQSKIGRIEKRVLIKASPAIIFQALTDAKDLVHWFCDRATCDPREGGTLAVCWKAGKFNQKGSAVFTQIIQNSLIELRWVDDGNGQANEDSAHDLSYTIRSRRNGCEVAVQDKDDFQTDEETWEVLNLGWNSVLLELKDYCERKERSAKTRGGTHAP